MIAHERDDQRRDDRRPRVDRPRRRLPAQALAGSGSAASLLALQRAAGNRAVAAWLAREYDGTPKSSAAGGTWDTGAAKVVPLVPAPEISAKQTTILGKLKAMWDIADNVKDLADKVHDAGSDDPDLIELAKTINGVHASLNKIADGFQKLANEDSDVISKDAKAVKAIDSAIEAADAILALSKTKAAADAFADKPSYDTASAWADQVGDAFEKAGALLPVSALPSFMQQYFKGVFGAPKNYIAAFQGLMNQHYKGLDAATGVHWWQSGPSHHKAATPKEGGEAVWEGELTDVYIQATIADAVVRGDPNMKTGLPGYMRAHRKVSGVDLWNVDSARVGLGLLQAQIQSDASLDGPTQAAYLAFLSAQ